MPIEIPDEAYLEYVLLKRGGGPARTRSHGLLYILGNMLLWLLGIALAIAAIATAANNFGLIPPGLLPQPQVVFSTPVAAPAAPAPAQQPVYAAPADAAPVSAPAQDAPAAPPPLYQPAPEPAPANVGPSEAGSGFDAAAEPGCDQACADESARLAADLKARAEYEAKVKALYMPDATPRVANVGPSERTQYDVSQGDVLP